MKFFSTLFVSAFLFAGLPALFLAGCAAEKTMLTSNDRIIFFGDSITELGAEPNGFVTLIRDSLQKKYGQDAPEVIGAGVSGNKVTDLEKRIDRDVLSKKPTLVAVYIGINDVWHYALPGLKGTPKDLFETDLKDIIEKIQKVGARVILCTPSVIGEKYDGTNPQDSMLEEYSAIGRRAANETSSQLCDLRKAFIAYLKQHNTENVEKGMLTRDRVHLTDEGNRFVAEQMLKVIDGE
ncbi:MAG: SGNH/GDSL hydrolase family protein [Bacteroidota bacterium]|nr:SGNH/GDSL hydrolase family protein [Bacteroidota bacterium]